MRSKIRGEIKGKKTKAAARLELRAIKSRAEQNGAGPAAAMDEVGDARRGFGNAPPAVYIGVIEHLGFSGLAWVTGGSVRGLGLLFLFIKKKRAQGPLRTSCWAGLAKSWNFFIFILLFF